MLEHTFSTYYHSNSIFLDNYIPRLACVREYSTLDHTLLAHNTSPHYLQISLIELGQSKCIIDNISYKVMKGDIIILHPKTNYHFQQLTDKKFQAITLRIDNLRIPGLLPNHIQFPNTSPIIHSYKKFPNLPMYFKLCKDLAIQSQNSLPIDYNPQTTLLQSLLSIIYQLNSKKNLEYIPKELIEEQIKNYIDEHYLEEISLDILGKALHLSSSYLAHKFKAYTGISPIQYVIKKRLNEAQKLLLNTNLTITQISFHCGFNNSNYFQQIFTANMGISPGKYRKLWKSNKN